MRMRMRMRVRVLVRRMRMRTRMRARAGARARARRARRGEGVGPHDQTRPPGTRRQDHLHRRSLPLLHPRQGVRDHRPLPPHPQGRGPQNHARPEADPRRPAHPLQGLCRRRRRRRPRRARRQVREGGRDRDPRRDHRREALRHPGPPRVLGEPHREAAHRSGQAHREVRLRSASPRPGAARDWDCGGEGAEEAAADGGCGGCFHVVDGAYSHAGELCEGDVRGHLGVVRVLDAGFVEGDQVCEVPVPEIHRLLGRIFQGPASHPVR
mmetsp:Transcript_23181/g.61448  ORF Transcript_23181/g.61448 Transcript_23181/m.61448 type:complete len:267 (+) Transcript_23181:1-801(+)